MVNLSYFEIMFYGQDSAVQLTYTTRLQLLSEGLTSHSPNAPPPPSLRRLLGTAKWAWFSELAVSSTMHYFRWTRSASSDVGSQSPPQLVLGLKINLDGYI